MKKLNTKKGFSLIELLVVIAIIGVLSAVGIKSNIENIGLEEVGIMVDRDKIIVNDWYQTNNCVIVSLYTKRKSPKYCINSENILVDINEKPSNEKKGKITEKPLKNLQEVYF